MQLHVLSFVINLPESLFRLLEENNWNAHLKLSIRQIRVSKDMPIGFFLKKIRAKPSLLLIIFKTADVVMFF